VQIESPQPEIEQPAPRVLHPKLSKRDLEVALYGANPEQRIVAVETDTRSTPCTATLFLRPKDSEETHVETVPFYPWMVLKDERPLPEVHTTRLLDGPNGYKHHVWFENWKAFQEGRRILRDERRDHLDYGSAIKNFMVGEGYTQFKGMAFPDVRRMQVDIGSVACGAWGAYFYDRLFR
jgi:DNA polymerase I